MSLEQKEMNPEEWTINLGVVQAGKEIQALRDSTYLWKIIL